MPLYSIHIHYFAEVLPCLFCHGIFKVAVALIFTAVLQIFTRGEREVGACGKDEVLPQPDGSILSGGTVAFLGLGDTWTLRRDLANRVLNFTLHTMSDKSN